MNSLWVFELSSYATPLVHVKKRYFRDLFFDQGYVWEAIKWEMEYPAVTCLYRMIEYDDLEKGIVTLTDICGVAAPLTQREIRVACRIRSGAS
jgi:hypothetical protein